MKLKVRLAENYPNEIFTTMAGNTFKKSDRNSPNGGWKQLEVMEKDIEVKNAISQGFLETKKIEENVKMTTNEMPKEKVFKEKIEEKKDAKDNKK